MIFEYLYTLFDSLLGLSLPRSDLSWLNMGSRAIIIYIIGIVIVRMGTKRIQGKPTTFDIMLFLILGSVLSRAINGDSPFFATITTTFVLMFVHYIFSVMTFYSSNFGTLLKGTPIVLVKDGKILWVNMKKAFISENDLLSSLRLRGKVIYPKDVKLAVLERNGEISIIPYATSEKVKAYNLDNIIIYTKRRDMKSS
jgi:uncharacterized membrane protein YcaP (DUF421 family)